MGAQQCCTSSADRDLEALEGMPLSEEAKLREPDLDMAFLDQQHRQSIRLAVLEFGGSLKSAGHLSPSGPDKLINPSGPSDPSSFGRSKCIGINSQSDVSPGGRSKCISISDETDVSSCGSTGTHSDVPSCGRGNRISISSQSDVSSCGRDKRISISDLSTQASTNDDPICDRGRVALDAKQALKMDEQHRMSIRRACLEFGAPLWEGSESPRENCVMANSDVTIPASSGAVPNEANEDADASDASHQELSPKATVSSAWKSMSKEERIKKGEAIVKACKNGTIEKVRKLLSQGTRVDARSSEGRCALHTAAAYGEVEIVRMLLQEYSAKINSTHRSTGETALHLACKFDQKATIELLVELGADVTLRSKGGLLPSDILSLRNVHLAEWMSAHSNEDGSS